MRMGQAFTRISRSITCWYEYCMKRASHIDCFNCQKVLLRKQSLIAVIAATDKFRRHCEQSTIMHLLIYVGEAFICKELLSGRFLQRENGRWPVASSSWWDKWITYKLFL